MKTRIVNLRKEHYDVYIGRGSLFGNPMRIGEKVDGKIEPITREEAIAWYKEYFYIRLGVALDFKKQVLALRGKTLGCFCKPQKCHGDIIVEYLEKS